MTGRRQHQTKLSDSREQMQFESSSLVLTAEGPIGERAVLWEQPQVPTNQLVALIRCNAGIGEDLCDNGVVGVDELLDGRLEGLVGQRGARR